MVLSLRSHPTHPSKGLRGIEGEPFPHSSPTIIPKADRGVKTKMDYLTIFLLTRANTAFFGCFTAEANASADFLLEKISNHETSENSELTFTIHTNFFITTLSKDFQNGEEPFPHSSPTIIPKAGTGVKTIRQIISTSTPTASSLTS